MDLTKGQWWEWSCYTTIEYMGCTTDAHQVMMSLTAWLYWHQHHCQQSEWSSLVASKLRGWVESHAGTDALATAIQILARD